jgi:uncharacterized protein DUF6636
MRLVLVLVSFALFVLVMPAMSSGAGGVTSFRTPSKNIYCARETLGRTDMLRCDVGKLAHKAPKPKGCHFGYGTSFGMTARGHARALCVSDSVFDSHASVLAYSSTRKFGPFTCTSKTTGLTCSNRSRYGFTLNRTRYKLF